MSAPVVPTWSWTRSHTRWWAFLAAVLAMLVSADFAWGHGAPLDRRVGWWDWNGDPVIIVNLLLLTWLYVRGLGRLWDRAGVGRVVTAPQAVAFALGMLGVVVALVSPLDGMSEQLASAHMVQHMILMTVAAPLMVLGAPMLVWLWGLSPGGRRAYQRGWRWLEACGFPWRELFWHPLVPWTVYAMTIWVWHLPVLYGAALRNAFVHDLQHVCFFLASCVFWRVVLDPVSRFRLNGLAGVLYLFTTTLHATVLGVFMALAPSLWYPDYLGRTELWNLTPLEDQQLAGLIMWMPACMPYAIVAVVILGVSLHARGRSKRIPARPMRVGRLAASTAIAFRRQRRVEALKP